MEDLNPNVFNMITGINTSKILTKHISFKFECRFDGRKCNSNQKRNGDKCRLECKTPKKITCMKNVTFGVLLCVVVEMVNM